MQMFKATSNLNLSDFLDNYLSDFKFKAGISSSKNFRKKVLKNENSLQQVARGFKHKTSAQKDDTTNIKILSDFYTKYNFKLYKIAFSSQNPNFPNFLNSIKFLTDENSKRFENAIVANIKNCLDTQRIKFNSTKTAEIKKFNRFGIDSRQFQNSFEAEKI